MLRCDSPSGYFVISLDFELYWGVRDKRSFGEFKDRLNRVRYAIDQMLELFKKYDIQATWATVGFLFLSSLEELKSHIPHVLPVYDNPDFSPYPYIEKSVLLDFEGHFASDVITALQKVSGQEIGSHTYSHYYCLEEGQTLDAFRSDIQMAVDVARQRGLSSESIVFPRNQLNPTYLSVLNECGIKAYRGNEQSWLYQAEKGSGQYAFRRILRLVDSYINISGCHTYDVPTLDPGANVPMNIPSSRFLRPYCPKLSFLEPVRLSRITRSMTDAATRSRVFHLWWHPHNFAYNTQENIACLDHILRHYVTLRDRYGFSSVNMSELVRIASKIS